MKYYILYNPLAGHGSHDEKLNLLKTHLNGECVDYNVTDISDYNKLFGSLNPEDKIVISGGDGTLNRFINAVDTDSITNDILYYASGNGNDFLRDVEHDASGAPFKINQYLKDLPTVTVKGKTYKYLNGVGYGIDGYCCEEGDRLKAKNKKVDYTAIAIKGLLFAFKPTNAIVNVDGKEYKFGRVWIAPTMNGRYYGGGMIATPDHDRLGDGTQSLMVLYGSGKLKTLMVFPSIFKGEHVKHTEMVSVFKGREITVSFNRPCALQIDGETILDVTSYTVKSGK